jgi:hypothetical protein
MSHRFLQTGAEKTERVSERMLSTLAHSQNARRVNAAVRAWASGRPWEIYQAK